MAKVLDKHSRAIIILATYYVQLMFFCWNLGTETEQTVPVNSDPGVTYRPDRVITYGQRLPITESNRDEDYQAQTV